MSRCSKKNKKYIEKKLNTTPSPARSLLCPSPVCRPMKEFQGSLLTSSIPTINGPESSPCRRPGARSSERPSSPPRPGANQPLPDRCRGCPVQSQGTCFVVNSRLQYLVAGSHDPQVDNSEVQKGKVRELMRTRQRRSGNEYFYLAVRHCSAVNWTRTEALTEHQLSQVQLPLTEHFATPGTKLRVFKQLY